MDFGDQSDTSTLRRRPSTILVMRRLSSLLFLSIKTSGKVVRARHLRRSYKRMIWKPEGTSLVRH